MATEVALNEEGINSLIYDINSYTTKIRKVLYAIENVIDSTKMNFDCEAADKLRKNFEYFKEGFPTIYNNLLSYKKDMFKVKEKFRSQEVVLSNILAQGGQRLKAEDK